MITNWSDIKKAYPEGRSSLTHDRELALVNVYYNLLEAEGFSDVFMSAEGEHEHNGESFVVMNRVPELQAANGGAPLESLPMWDIRFDNGDTARAMPEEIINVEAFTSGRIPLSELVGCR